MVGKIALCKKPICARSSGDGFRAPATAGGAGEPAVAPGRGGIRVFQGSSTPNIAPWRQHDLKICSVQSRRLRPFLGCWVGAEKVARDGHSLMVTDVSD